MGGHGAPDDRRRPSSRADEREELLLIERIRAGELGAFEALYRNYHPRLWRFLINLIHRPQLVEEVLSDTMLVVWNQPERFSGASKLSTWIFAIAYRKAMKALRRADEPIEDKEAERRESAEPGPDQQLNRKQVQQLLSSAMAALSPDQRAVVDLTYFHEMPYHDIAEIMGCPVDTVKTRMFHARRHLRRVLAGPLADLL